VRENWIFFLPLTMITRAGAVAVRVNMEYQEKAVLAAMGIPISFRLASVSTRWEDLMRISRRMQDILKSFYSSNTPESPHLLKFLLKMSANKLSSGRGWTGYTGYDYLSFGKPFETFL